VTVAASTHERQKELLHALSQMGSSGRAEGEDQSRFPRTYFPVPEHLRAFDPDVVLVVGPRGAGKTELFRAGIELSLLPAIGRRLPRLRLPPLKGTRFVKAYPLGRDFPDDIGLKQFAAQSKPGGDSFIELWFAYLVRTLGDAVGRDGLDRLLQPPGGDAAAVLEGFRACGQAPLLALDRLDEQLERDGGYLFIGYDELDTLGHGDWRTINAAVQGLVGFWSPRSRRWRRIRAKVFLRTDLYERAGVSAGADFAKLAANRGDITWSDANLYAMLVKRVANVSADLLDYCSSKVGFEDDEILGHIPRVKTAAEARPLVERMIGPYMGANAGKGLTFKWLLDHIRDGRGHALPRALVRLVERAAEVQRASGELPRSPRLVEPRALRRALDRVSEEHVEQSRSEWPWLEGLKERLKAEREVPWERRQVERLLAKGWEASWGPTEDISPPAGSARDLVDYLVEVGIFRDRSDGRIDVPDLFLAGLGLKRKGGVARG
jgi:hypothetical protein